MVVLPSLLISIIVLGLPSSRPCSLSLDGERDKLWQSSSRMLFRSIVGIGRWRETEVGRYVFPEGRVGCPSERCPSERERWYSTELDLGVWGSSLSDLSAELSPSVSILSWSVGELCSELFSCSIRSLVTKVGLITLSGRVGKEGKDSTWRWRSSFWRWRSSDWRW